MGEIKGWPGWINPHAGLALIFGLILLLVASCSDFPFQVRKSAPPPGSATQVVPATEDRTVLSNLRICVEDRKAEQFIAQLAPDFIFVADPSDVAVLERDYYSGIFSDWDLQVEDSVIQYMLDNGRCSLAMLDSLAETDTTLERTDSTSLIQADYRLLLVLDREVPKTQTYSGRAWFSMRKQSDNLWKMYRWEDFKIPGGKHDTWGYLRGVIRAKIPRG